MVHRLTFTPRELALLEDRLAVINPNDYDLDDYSLLRALYGRIIHLRLVGRSRKPKTQPTSP